VALLMFFTGKLMTLSLRYFLRDCEHAMQFECFAYVFSAYACCSEIVHGYNCNEFVHGYNYMYHVVVSVCTLP
jgi:hypothetical protein